MGVSWVRAAANLSGSRQLLVVAFAGKEEGGALFIHGVITSWHLKEPRYAAGRTLS
jgi:hypothetical protein